MDDQTMMRVAVVGIAVLAALAVVWLLVRRRQTAALRERFGPEYDRVRQSTRTTAEAERELMQRQRRVESFSLRSLARDQAEQYVASWRTIQARFVDDPHGAIVDADRLIEDVMRSRGYPLEDVDRRLDDLSVDHAAVVSHYRAGRDLVGRHERGEASTEDLRLAMVHYRALFDELVGEHRGHARRAS
jgi:hypothetical protein